MCGFTVFYSYDQVDEVLNDNVKKSLLSMHYRGPDGKGFWADNKTSMGHVRLSIIGIDNGAQPISDNRGRFQLVCNGEIYNYKDLKKELELKGYDFQTLSDSEVIIYLYQEYGEKLLDKLRGMFAFALWDIESQCLFVARDHSGQKPLYYSKTSRGIVFSSELKAIADSFYEKNNLTLNEMIVNSIYSNTYSLGIDQTFVNEILRVKPAEKITVIDNQVFKKDYWDLHNIMPSTIKDPYKEILEKLRESVQLHLQSDVPVAVLLSGGIDSSAIACLAKEISSEVHAITVGYECKKFKGDERELAQRLAKDKGLIWHNIELSEEEYKNYLSEIVEVMDEPNGDIASFAQWSIYKKSKELGFKVLLSGNGGDELFFGYPGHNITGEFIQFLNRISKTRLMRFSALRWISVIIILIFKNFSDVLFQLEKKINASLLFPNGGQILPEQHYFHFKGEFLEKIYYFLFKVWLPNNCYFLGDKLGMGNSLEVRNPFADHELVELAYSIPMELRYDKKLSKGFLRKALKGVVPDYVLYAKKRGFTPPSDYISEVISNYEYKYLKNVPLNNFASITIDHFLNRYFGKKRK